MDVLANPVGNVYGEGQQKCRQHSSHHYNWRRGLTRYEFLLISYEGNIVSSVVIVQGRFSTTALGVPEKTAQHCYQVDRAAHPRGDVCLVRTLVGKVQSEDPRGG